MIEKYRFSREIKNQIKALYEYDNYHGPLAVFKTFSWIILAILAVQFVALCYPISLLVIGSRQRALATVLHEASHGILAKNKKLELVLGTFFSGYLIFQTWGSYKKSHTLDHHHKLGDSGKDPDFKYYQDSGVFEVETRAGFIYKHLVKPALFLNVFKSLKYLINNRFLRAKNPKELVGVVLSQVCLFLVFYFSVGVEGYFLFWMIPYLTTFQALTWFIELAEHYPMIATAKTDLCATRNRFSHPVESFFTGMHGENFHLIHHLFPAVPYWNLKRARQVLLKDRNYAAANASFGGIFISSNFAPSMWGVIIKNHQNNTDYQEYAS
ncbi:guanitoxin biosynthesis L-arginine gamma (S) hydroxylase [Pseudomonas sp. TCU-HL1]|uniref:guanitoxin biosynthesis L-arginine gamma (S) hydroxylase n=1 Tax=Pseudomonas sp. TCU-HL1 TaxID=1856685 RepID=UPI0008554644|nr:guanitoxin biosynthesis L-arginine gamma (S) hydroxylase [Pseudomonas sp. TCU-HL1]AOE87529.1 hypothetical protein THL1_4981 [Pseudomonas sp. TCU-HL1]